MFSRSENTISETIDVSIYGDTKKDASMAVDLTLKTEAAVPRDIVIFGFIIL